MNSSAKICGICAINWVIIFLISSCANVVAPTGGSKDIIPPKMVKAFPDTFATHFSEDKIKILFDEFIQLQDAYSQVIISPPTEKKPEFQVKGKSIVIHFNEKLKENTTYNINFGKSVADLHEANIFENFQYIFSTGDYIDSLSLSGKCVVAKDLKPEKGTLVMLYNTLEDSVPVKQIPLYFSTCNDSGVFKISNVKAGSYKIFALKDANSNYLFDQPNEIIGFKDQPIAISGKDTASLRLFEEETSKQYIKKSYSQHYGKVIIIFNKPVVDCKTEVLNPGFENAKFYPEWLSQKDTLLLWFDKFSADSMKLKITEAGKIIDTLNFGMKSREGIKGKGMFDKKLRLFVNTDLHSDRVLDLNSNISLTLSNPLSDWLPDSIKLLEDSIPVKYKIIPDSASNSILHNLKIVYTWKEKKIYKLEWAKNTFTDIFGIKNDTSGFVNFNTKALRDYGTMKIHIKSPSSTTQFVALLMDDKENVYRKTVFENDTTLSYEFLNPGAYKLKIIFDSNKNGKWDTGNYFKHIQPEKVIYYPDLLTVRHAWDIEADWLLK